MSNTFGTECLIVGYVARRSGDLLAASHRYDDWSPYVFWITFRAYSACLMALNCAWAMARLTCHTERSCCPVPAHK
jgi:uncharacterized membrane protein